MAIQTWLLNLEAVFDSEGGKLPDTVFAQIDGGSENANLTTKAMCELLVSRRLTRKVVLTRLPVGRTNEDIDSVFGKIWTYLDGKSLFAPQKYERALRAALAQRNVDVRVVDVFCVPEYNEYMKPYVDKKFERSDKEDWTELQWIFEAVDHCEAGCSCAKCSL